MKKLVTVTTKLAALGALLAGAASANIVIAFTGVTGASAPFTWSYNVSVDTSQNFNPGDKFCVSNIAGYVAGTGSFSAGWTMTQNLAGGCPFAAGDGTRPDAAPSLSFVNTTANTYGPLASIGTLMFNDNYNLTTGRIAVGAVGHRFTTGEVTSNQGDAFGPAAPAGVPEPATLLFLGSGMVALALVRRARKA